MANPAFTAVTGGAVALSAATAKTVLSVIPGTVKGLTVTAVDVTFDGVTSSAVPALVELCLSDATGAGSATPVIPGRIRGQAATTQSLASKNYSAEPTVLTPVKEWLVPPTSGVLYQFPLGREIEAVGGNSAATPTGRGGLMVRVTAPATVNVRAVLEWEE